MMEDLVRITEDPIDLAEVVSALSCLEVGAVVTFVGTVREIENGERILYLEYEAYEEMAREELLRICREIKNRWPTVQKVAFVHRIGRVGVGEAAVAIGVSAPHRAETFPALAYAVDRLKESVPIWKKQVGEKGARWKPTK